MSGAAGDTTAQLGQLLAVAAKPFAVELTRELSELGGWFERANIGLNQLAQGIQENNIVFAKTNGYEAYKSKIDEINTALGPFTTKIQALTPEQYNFAQSLIRTGLSADEAFKRIQAFQGVISQTQDLFDRSIFTYDASAQALGKFSTAQLEAANASDAGQAAALGIAQAVAAGGITLEEGTAILQKFTEHLREVAAANALLADSFNIGSNAVQLFNNGVNESAAAAIQSKATSDALKISQENLTNAAIAAAQGLGVTAQSAALLGNQFGITTASAYGLISAMQQIEVAKAKQTSGLSPKDFDSNAQYLQAVKDDEAAMAAAKARQAYNYEISNTAGKLALANGELKNTIKGTAEYYTALTKVATIQKQLDAENNKPPKLTPNQKLNTSLLDGLDKFNNKEEDAEQKHYDALAKIYDEYAKKQAEQEAKNEVGKRRGRLDFYTNLNDPSVKGIDKNAFAAEYEQAFAKAQEIAKSGKAKLASEFLDLRTKQIEELQKLAEDEAAIDQNRKDGKISKQDAAAEKEFLAGKKKLIQDAQDEEQKQLVAAGDDNQKKLQEQLDGEAEAYSKNTDKIATQAERAANAKIVHAERSKIAVDQENKSLATQESIYARIAAKNGGVLPHSATPTNNVPVAAPASTDGTSAAKPLNVEATKPLPIDTGEGVVVKQNATWFVQDDVVNNTLLDIGVRLETRLGDVVSAITSAQDTISSAVRNVESAVGRIKISANVIQG